MLEVVPPEIKDSSENSATKSVVMSKVANRLQLAEFLEESGVAIWVPKSAKAENSFKPIEIKALESALHLPRVKVLFCFPEELMDYWGKIQELFFNIAATLNLEKFEYLALFGSQEIWSDLGLIQKLCRRTSARKVVGFGVKLSESWMKSLQEQFSEKLMQINVVLTQNLSEVWDHPIQKKQVWNDVSRILF